MYLFVYSLSYINGVLPDYKFITMILHLLTNIHEAKVFPFIARLSPPAFRSIFPDLEIARKESSGT